MVSHSCSHDVPVGERGKKCEAIECILGQIKNIPYVYVFYGKQWMVTGPFDLKSFRYKSFDTYLFSRVVNSFTYLSLRTKNIFTHNVFLVHAQTILEVIEIFSAVSLLEFVSKQLVSKRLVTQWIQKVPEIESYFVQ